MLLSGAWSCACGSCTTGVIVHCPHHTTSWPARELSDLRQEELRKVAILPSPFLQKNRPKRRHFVGDPNYPGPPGTAPLKSTHVLVRQHAPRPVRNSRAARRGRHGGSVSRQRQETEAPGAGEVALALHRYPVQWVVPAASDANGDFRRWTARRPSPKAWWMRIWFGYAESKFQAGPRAPPRPRRWALIRAACPPRDPAACWS